MIIESAPEYLLKEKTSWTKYLKMLEVGQMFKAPIKERTKFNQLALQIGIKVKTKKISEDQIAVIRIK